MEEMKSEIRELILKIINEECLKAGKLITLQKNTTMMNTVLDTAYSIGAGFDEETLRKITKAMLEHNIIY